MPSYAVFDDAIVARVGAATTGWTSFSNLQTVFDLARSQDRPLFFQPGTYASGTTMVLATNGGGKPLEVRAIPGSVVLQFNGTDIFLNIDSQNQVRFEGIIFYGDNRPLADFVAGRPSFIAVSGGSQDVSFEKCQIGYSPGIGIYVTDGSDVLVRDTRLTNHSIGIWSENARISVLSSSILDMTNNGIAIWQNSIAGDTSTVSDNIINGIDSVAGGTGQYGNAVSIFRAVGVIVCNNKIFNTKYSAIRCNGGGLLNISNNNIFNTREVAIFIEAPTEGINLTGCIVSNNSIDTAGKGINVANSGQFSDGVSRSVVVEGNRISNVLDNHIPDPGYYPPTTGGVGISVEQDCVVSGNLIEGAAVAGIQVGINTGARDLVVTGNLVRNAAIGIGVSNDALNDTDRSIVVSSNIVRNANVGGIVPTLFTGTTLVRVGTTEYGNAMGTAVGSVTFGLNRFA